MAAQGDESTRHLFSILKPFGASERINYQIILDSKEGLLMACFTNPLGLTRAVRKFSKWLCQRLLMRGFWITVTSIAKALAWLLKEIE